MTASPIACRAIGLALLATLAGCARAWIPLDDVALRRRRPRTLLLVVHRNDAFTFHSGLRSGPVGAEAKGREVVTANHIVDPAIALGDELAAGLRTAYGLDRIVIEQGEVSVNRDPPPGLADLVLELRTTRWGAGPAPWREVSLLVYADARMAVHYRSEATLTDTRDGTILATAKRVGDDPRIIEARSAKSLSEQERLTAFAPSASRMLAAGAALLKGQLGAAGRRCGDRYRTMLFPGNAP